MDQGPPRHHPSDDKQSAFEFLAAGDRIVLRFQEDGNRKEHSMSLEDAWDLLGNFGVALGQVARSRDHDKTPIHHERALVIPNEMAELGTSTAGMAVLAFASRMFPTVHIPLTPEQTELFARGLGEISRLQKTGGSPN